MAHTVTIDIAWSDLQYPRHPVILSGSEIVCKNFGQRLPSDDGLVVTNHSTLFWLPDQRWKQLEDDMFDLATVDDDIRRRVVAKAVSYPNGHGSPCLERECHTTIYCYHKTTAERLYVGCDWGRVVCWKR